MYKLSKEQISDYKELFILFDKDTNGVLSFTELGTAMKTLGQRLPGNQVGENIMDEAPLDLLNRPCFIIAPSCILVCQKVLNNFHKLFFDRFR